MKRVNQQSPETDEKSQRARPGMEKILVSIAG